MTQLDASSNEVTTLLEPRVIDVPAQVEPDPEYAPGGFHDRRQKREYPPDGYAPGKALHHEIREALAGDSEGDFEGACTWEAVRALLADRDALAADAARYRVLRARGRCDSKHGAGVVVGDRLEATVAFRYWCTPEQLDSALDSLSSGVIELVPR